MNAQFTSRGSGIITAGVELHANGVKGAGRAEFSVLAVFLKMQFQCPAQMTGSRLDFRELRCRVSPFEEAYIAYSQPAFLNVQVQSKKVHRDEMVVVEIPLDHRRLALINRLRKGGDVKLRLDLELLADELTEIRLQPSHWAFLARHRFESQLHIHISRSDWLQQILPGMEFENTHIIELPAIPINRCHALKSSFNALQQAQKLENQGFYDEAVAKCRIALEPFFETVDKPDSKGTVRKVPVLKAVWQSRLGQRTYDWLNSSLVTIKQATNQSHHLSSTSYDQQEAQMLLIVTTALLAYVAKVDEKTPE